MANTKVQNEVSPTVVTIIIVLVVLIVGLVFWKMSQPQRGYELKPGQKGPGSQGIIGPGRPGPMPGESAPQAPGNN